MKWWISVFFGFLITLGCIKTPGGADSLPMWRVFQIVEEKQGIPLWSDDMYLGHAVEWVHSPFYLTFVVVCDLLMNNGFMFVFSLIFWGSFFTMYLFAKKILKNKNAAIFAAFVYLLVPFHFLQAFFEGHQHLSLAYFFLPLGFLSVHSNLLFGTLFLCMPLLAQPQQIILAIPFIAIYALIKKRFWHFAKIFCFSLFVSSFWWFPLLFFRDLFFWTKFELQGWPMKLFNILTLRPCISPHISSCYNITLPYPITVLSFLTPVLAIFGFFASRNYAFAILGLISGLLSMGTNTPIYDLLFQIPFFDSLRVPYRFLAITTISFAILSGEWIKKFKIKRFLFAVLVFSIFVASGVEFIDSMKNLEVKEVPALEYLKTLPDGKVFVLPALPWIMKNGVISIDSGYFSWMHEKKLVDGTLPSYSVKELGEFFERVDNCSLSCNMNVFFDILGAKYVYVDESIRKTGCVHFDLKLLKRFGNISIYENEDAFPDAYALNENDWKYARSAKLECGLKRIEFKEIEMYGDIIKVNSEKTVHVVFTRAFYPFWVVDIENGTKIYGKRVFGVLTGFELPSGEYSAKIKFEKPWQRRVGEIVGAFSFLALVGIGLKRCMTKD